MRKSPSVYLFALAALVAASLGCGPEDAAGERTLPPDIQSLEVDDAPVDPGTETTVRVEATPGSGSGSAEGGLAAGLEASWAVDGDGWSIEGDGATATLTAADQYASTGTVTVTVTGSEGGSNEATLEVETGENVRPRILDVTASPMPVQPTQTATLEASAEDERGDSLTYEWSAPEGWTLESKTGATVELTAPDEDGATGEVQLDVSDGYGETVSTKIRVETTDNAPPSISSMTASPPQTEPGGTITVKVDAADPDGDELGYEWSAPMGWTVEGEGAEVTVTAPDRYGANGEVSVTITDPRDHEASGRVLVSTQSNDGPRIDALTANPQEVDRGGTIDLSVNASDPNGDALTYIWSVSESNWSLSKNGETAKLTAPPAPGKSTRVEVTVRDTEGKSASSSIVVSTASNQGPSIGSVTANPAQVSPGGTVQLDATASDPDGDDLTYSWQGPAEWNVNDNGDQATATAPNKYGVTATFSVTVKDGFGGRSTGSVTVSTDRNQAPTISGVTANPPVVDKGGQSSVTVTASDPNGDSLSYAWKLPGGWTQNGSGSSITVDAPDKYDARGLIEVGVTDGNGGETKGTVVLRTETNRPPLVVSMSATKTTLEPGEKSTISVNATDPENDSLSYSWNLPSGWQGSSTSDSIEVTAPRKYSESVDVEVVIDDGHNKVTQKQTLKTVSNSPPTVKSMKAKPNPVAPGSTTKVTVDAEDPLGDPLKYNWSVNNGGTINGSGKTVTVDAPQTPGATMTATVVVDDQHGEKVTKSLDIKVVDPSGSKKFTHTGSPQTFTVPKYVDEVTIKAWGAEGGGAKCCDGNVQDDGGHGGYAKGTLSVSPGDKLHVYVGGEGITEGRGGFNGGGPGERYGAGGGGASDVRVGGQSLQDRVIVAGGGGGGNCGCPDHGSGGDGGGLQGERGSSSSYTPGGGGTQNSGGSAGSRSTSGQLGDGGGQTDYHEAGGGGGYYGGGGAYAAGGGGGSSYLDPSLSNTSTKQGQNDSGHGRIVIEW